MMKKVNLLLAGIAGIMLLYGSINGLLVEGIFNWHIGQPEFRGMMTELIIFGGLLAVCLIPRWIPAVKAGGSLFVLAVFLWLHTMLVPVVTVVLYGGYILLLGNMLRIMVFRLQTKVNVLVDFFLGSLGLVALFCLMSMFSLGGTAKLFIGMVLLGIPLLVFAVLRFPLRKNQLLKSLRRSFTLNNQQGLCLWGIMLFFIVQAGRLNSSIDFDSQWYGVRSAFILDNGKGIFENLGTVSFVYTYSKGMEVLTLPLAGLPSYSFLISFNLMTSLLVLYGCYQLLQLFMNKTNSLMVCLWIASIPGIMNMGISAKSDMVTLAVQIMLLVFQIYYIYEEKVIYLILSISALLFSWTLKPTAMIFSTAIFGMFGIYILATRQLRFREKVRTWLVTGLAAFVWLALWMRTFLLTGVPVTSVFSAALTKIGFKMKYPYESNGVVNYSPNLFSREGVNYIIKRIYGIFINPSDERMTHVVIAWGSMLILFALLLILLFAFQSKTVSKGTKELKKYLYVIFLPFMAVNFVSMLILYRPDGNYFMLFYVLALIIAGICCYHLKWPAVRTGIYVMIIPFLLANLVFSSLTNWAWNLGFSERKPFQAYVNHQELAHEEMIAAGNGEIWDILAADSRTRVIGIGYHTNVMVFPCSIQSYYDLWTWGNPEIIHSATNLKEFMAYAKTDYVYIERNFVDEGSSYSRMISRLLLDGVLVDLLISEGNILAKVELENPRAEEGRSNYNRFLAEYQFFIEEEF